MWLDRGASWVLGFGWARESCMLVAAVGASPVFPFVAPEDCSLLPGISPETPLLYACVVVDGPTAYFDHGLRSRREKPVASATCSFFLTFYLLEFELLALVADAFGNYCMIISKLAPQIFQINFSIYK